MVSKRVRKYIISATVMIFIATPALSTAPRKQGNLSNECLTSLLELEDLLIAYRSLTDLNPSVYVSIARINMLINLIRFCEKTGLLVIEKTKVVGKKKCVTFINLNKFTTGSHLKFWSSCLEVCSFVINKEMRVYFYE